MREESGIHLAEFLAVFGKIVRLGKFGTVEC
jgi:hypothetical protein